MSKQEIRKAGLKVTLPRLRVLEVMEDASKESLHYSAEDVYKELLRRGEEVGLATVYRVLTQFESAGLVSRHNFEGGRSVYELTEVDHHDHMVCLSTGKIIEFHEEAIELLQQKIADEHGYELVGHNLVLYVKPLKK
jgi:Fur family transcriptional regulator, ferric uptake regulator